MSAVRRQARLLPAVALVLFAGCASSAPAVRHAEAISASRTQVESIRRANQIPAMAVAVIDGDRIVWIEGFGAPPDSLFRIGSVSKLLTASALVRLAGEGVVDLGAPVTRYVSNAPANGLTLLHLARHLGGIRHYGRGDFINMKEYPSVTASLEKFIKGTPLALPGEKYIYSSYGYNLIGASIEAASGRPFQRTLTEAVLAPWKMRDTVAFPDEQQRKRVTVFYNRGSDGVTEAGAVDLSDRIPSGGYLSTAGDLARFLIGTMALPEAQKELLWTSGRTTAGEETGVGFSWRIGRDEGGRTFVHHGGQAVGGRAFVLLYPAERLGVVLLANLSFAPFNEVAAGEIAQRFLSSE